MADLVPATDSGLPAHHPLEAHAAEFIGQASAAFAVEPEPFVAMADVRVPAGAAGPSLLGAGLPSDPNTWVPGDAGRIVWLGPDEWLVTSTAHTPAELERAVAAAVGPLGGAAVDVSAQRIGLRLTGSRVREVLAKGCSIDLHPRSFGRGRAAQTTLGLAGVILLALSDSGDEFGVLVRSSFAGYLADWLLDAAAEFATAVTGPGPAALAGC